jgi:hypothetical protein
MRKVYGLSLIFIEFYVPALTRLSITEILLQLSENITLFAVCRMYSRSGFNYSSLHTQCTDRIRNTASKSPSIVACVSVAAVTYFGCPKNMFTEPLPSNEHLLWFFYPGLQQTSQNIK